MKKRVGLLGSLLLGAAMVAVGLAGDLALAAQNGQNGQQGQNGQNGQQGQNGQIGQIGQFNGVVSVPEPSSLILLLSAGVVGIGIWRRISQKA